ncbi:hypothetical protein [Sulfurimonas sp.]|mgnify:FL=1|jgi:hypothetical protein|uniref:hypothetical protein n=1 Tax=Sulfurimonas sp. TaxID=2022749 RepID=UPI0025FF07CC|nr:hypothetical protein [Sulfurimonas sp.]MBT5935860.1 hypothetical protein [Sulfurimonas sp.]
MNQINPLHIGALLVALIAFLLFTLSSMKTEMLEEKTLYETSEKLALKLSSLKDVYADKKKTKRAIERVLSQSSLKTAALDVKREKSSVRISSKSIDTKALNALMGKILNGSYNITELKIKKLSETKASLKMEIKW